MSDIWYVKSDTARAYWRATGTKEKDVRYHLLWGDRVDVVDKPAGRWEIRARGGQRAFVAKSALGRKPLLELYFIDVGQGDGVLMVTPDRRHVLIDGGWPRRGQPTGKNAIDFVDWKFKKDYGVDTIDLDAVVCSHNDQDHYGGLWDLFSTSDAARRELDVSGVTAEAIYHAGLSWWSIGGKRRLGSVADTTKGKMFTQLLGDRASVEAGLAPGANPPLQGEWKQFWQQAVKARRRDGGATAIERLSTATGFLPGFDSTSDVQMHVLAPVEFSVGTQPAIRRVDSNDSQNTNGNSVLLRLDYGTARILLTGDLNQNSQELLMTDYQGQRDEFQAHVAKGCHHGSRDVALAFLREVRPEVTIISSGDSEGHDHPTPEVVAASGVTGLESELGGRLSSPLIYITELARSVTLGTPTKVEVTTADGTAHSFSGDDLEKIKVTYKIVQSGDRSAKTVTRTMKRADKTSARQMVEFTTFGLVNVRTDGKDILVAARNEKDASWNMRKFEAVPLPR